MNDIDIEYANFKEYAKKLLDYKISNACIDYLEQHNEDSDETD